MEGIRDLSNNKGSILTDTRKTLYNAHKFRKYCKRKKDFIRNIKDLLTKKQHSKNNKFSRQGRLRSLSNQKYFFKGTSNAPLTIAYHAYLAISANVTRDLLWSIRWWYKRYVRDRQFAPDFPGSPVGHLQTGLLSPSRHK